MKRVPITIRMNVEEMSLLQELKEKLCYENDSQAIRGIIKHIKDPLFNQKISAMNANNKLGGLIKKISIQVDEFNKNKEKSTDDIDKKIEELKLYFSKIQALLEANNKSIEGIK